MASKASHLAVAKRTDFAFLLVCLLCLAAFVVIVSACAYFFLKYHHALPWGPSDRATVPPEKISEVVTLFQKSVSTMERENQIRKTQAEQLRTFLTEDKARILALREEEWLAMGPRDLVQYVTSLKYD